MNILEGIFVGPFYYCQEHLKRIIVSPCRGSSPSSVSATPKIWKPLPTEALTSRPAAPEPLVGISTAAIPRIPPAVQGIQWQLCKPGLQARHRPPQPTPASHTGPQHLPTGRGDQEIYTTPSPSQVSALEIGEGIGGTGCGPGYEYIMVMGWTGAYVAWLCAPGGCGRQENGLWMCVRWDLSCCFVSLGGLGQLH